MGLRKGDAVITTLDDRPHSEVVHEFNKLTGKRVTVYCWGSLNDVTGVVTGASVIGEVVSLQQGETFVRVPLADIVGVEAL